jgi:hypothetical protein
MKVYIYNWNTYEYDEFSLNLRHIKKTYLMFPHAFEHGCGRETMSYWFRKANGFLPPKNKLRKFLTALVRKRVFVKQQSSSGHSIFKLTDHLRKKDTWLNL